MAPAAHVCAMQIEGPIGMLSRTAPSGGIP